MLSTNLIRKPSLSHWAASSPCGYALWGCDSSPLKNVQTIDEGYASEIWNQDFGDDFS
jgi:hypothetical protein